ncbi:MAG: 4-hydroxythreonine-4-phosphate dehydrogenase PdxA, partial [Myxococcales bacterium]|nr:4-hydroxythreonine-4-phosphate dehydrogenase PdxA [Myxococcales bacterium]
AVTMGDPAGVGPEVIVGALGRSDVRELARTVVLGDRRAMERAARVLGYRGEIRSFEAPVDVPEDFDGIALVEMTTLADDDIAYGKPSRAAGDAVVRYIRAATDGCLGGVFDAMATAPITKKAMRDAGHPWPGHTEMLAEFTGSDDYAMMLAGDRLRVVLVTIHEPIRRVADLVTREEVERKLRVTIRCLREWWGIERPRIAVMGLNPHAGEQGTIGDEDQRIVAPAVEAVRATEVVDVEGPLAADSAFYFAQDGRYDAVLCMYHDQGLIPLKMLHFRDGINVTLGLPIIRTSVDHGTAYDLAGTGEADPASMVEAIRWAVRLAATRRRVRRSAA